MTSTALATSVSTNLPMLPILIPLLAAIIMLFFRRRIPFQRGISALASLIMVVVSLGLFAQVWRSGEMLVFCAGGWSAPFGIVLTMDLFSCIMVILSSIVSLACLWFSFRTIDEERERNYYYILWQFILVGINGSFVTGDLFNLFVFFEIMLMSSYVLMVLGNSRGQLRETFKYLIINIVSSTFFLIGLGVLYAMLGTMNMADIAAKIGSVENQGLITVVAMIFMVVFGLKGGLFPLFFWLPQSYTEPPAAVSALFGGLLTKVGVYALIRVFTLMFVGNGAFTHTILLVIAAGTMLFGVLGAVSRMNYKSILSYHIISQVGYMIMGLGLFSVWSLAGAIFYIAHHIIVKSCLFLTQGATQAITGTGELKQMGGLLSRFPYLGWTFLIAGLSLAGVPPLSGFFSKFVLMQDAVAQGNYWILFVAIVVGFLTLFSMIKIFMYVFWGKEKEIPAPATGFNYKKLLPPCLLLVALSIAMGLGAQTMIDISYATAQQLMNPEYYIQSVLSTVGGR